MRPRHPRDEPFPVVSVGMTRHNKVVHTLNFPEGAQRAGPQVFGPSRGNFSTYPAQGGEAVGAAEELEAGTLMIKPVVKIGCKNQHTNLTDLP